MKFQRISSAVLAFLLILTASFLPRNEAKADTAPFDPNKIVEYVLSRVGQTLVPEIYGGKCLKWVADVFRDCYKTSRISSCCAFKFGATYRDSSSRDNIPLGADVFFSGYPNELCNTCGNKCGHIGIYVGNGYVVHNWGSKVRKDSIAWIESVKSTQLTYYGWGWHGNMSFAAKPVTPTNTTSITSESVYSLRNCNSGKYMSIPSTIDGSSNDVGGSGRVVINSASGGFDQKIKFVAGDGGAWYLYPQALSSGRIIEIYRLNSQLVAGSRLALFNKSSFSATDGQFVIKWVGEGVCAILVKGNQTLAVAPQTSAGASTDFSDLYLVEYTGASWHHWQVQNSTGGWVMGNHAHSYDSWQHNGTQHWKVCSCGAQANVGAHTWDDGVITTEPTQTTPGVRTYSCTTCGRVKTESIPVACHYGDANLDGKANGADIILLARHLAKWDLSLSSAQLLAMDINADGNINGADIILFARYLAKWNVSLGPQ